MTDNKNKLMELEYTKSILRGWFMSNNEQIAVKFLDEMWDIAQESLRDKGDCKCHNNHIKAHAFWIGRFHHFERSERATAITITFKYCPECGRKLRPNEVR